MLPASAKRHVKSNNEAYVQNNPGGQSWQGTPRADMRRAGMQSSHSTSLPRHFNPSAGPDGKKREANTPVIPLIEYHLLDRDSPDGGVINKVNNRTNTYSKRAMYADNDDICEENESLFLSDQQRPTRGSKSGPETKPYIKYNSFAHY